MIEVVRAGSHICVVDQGRQGYGRYGIPVSGAMDMQSYLCGQAMVGSSTPHLAIEMYRAGHQIRFSEDCTIALTGSEAAIEINDRLVETNQLYSILSEDILSIGKMSRGCRLYLSIAAEIQSTRYLGSAAAIPGITNHLLRTGDVLRFNKRTFNTTTARIKPLKIDLSANIECSRGPEYRVLSSEQQYWLDTTNFIISDQSNRMGIRTTGDVCPTPILSSILTSPTTCGTVQLPPDGLPIMLMRDAQTTGGYPRVLILSEPSINQLAQRRPGDTIRFLIK